MGFKEILKLGFRIGMHSLKIDELLLPATMALALAGNPAGRATPPNKVRPR